MDIVQKMQIVWKRDTRRYSNGFLGYIGKWCCFNLYWDSSGSNRNGSHLLKCMLPGVKDDLGSFDEEAGKAKATQAAEHWFNNTTTKMVRTKK